MKYYLYFLSSTSTLLFLSIISASSVFFRASAIIQVDLRSLLIQTVWLLSIILYFLSSYNCANCKICFNFINHINCNRINWINRIDVVKTSIILIISIELSIGLICFNTGYYCQVDSIIFFQFSSLNLLIRQSLLWKLDLISCFILSDWSFILVDGNFVQILFWTVVCFVSHRVLLFPQIEIGFKIVI